VSAVRNSHPDGGAARRGAEYDGDPARGKDSLVWETALPCSGRRKGGDMPRLMVRAVWASEAGKHEGVGSLRQFFEEL
jgi:hypothetical protein